MKLTQKSAAALKLESGKTEQFFWDDELPGFGLRLRGVHRTWVAQCRTPTTPTELVSQEAHTSIALCGRDR
jgi:hypothetical protein